MGEIAGDFWKTKKPEFANYMMLPNALYPTNPDAITSARYVEMKRFCADTFGHREDGRWGDLWLSSVHSHAFAFRHEEHRLLFYMAFSDG